MRPRASAHGVSHSLQMPRLRARAPALARRCVRCISGVPRCVPAPCMWRAAHAVGHCTCPLAVCGLPWRHSTRRPPALPHSCCKSVSVQLTHTLAQRHRRGVLQCLVTASSPSLRRPLTGLFAGVIVRRGACTPCVCARTHAHMAGVRAHTHRHTHARALVGAHTGAAVSGGGARRRRHGRRGSRTSI